MNLLDSLRTRRVPFQQSAVQAEEIRLCCPFCQRRGETEDMRFRLGVNVRTGFANCFNCGWKSRKALGWLSRALDLGELTASAGALQKKKSVVRIRLPEDCTLLWTVWKDKFKWYRVAREYALSRGILRREAWDLHIGVCLVGRYAYRLIFPITYKGRLRAFVGRDFTGRGKPKYLNSTGEKFLYNAPDVPGNAGRKCILTEGIFDCLALNRLYADRYDVLALLGHTLTDVQWKIVVRYRRFVLWPDADSAGVRGFSKIAEVLVRAGKGIEVVLPTLKQDVDEVKPEVVDVLFCGRQPWSVGLGLRLRAMFAFEET